MKSLSKRRKRRARLVSFWAIVSLALLSLIVPRSEGLLTPSGDPQSGDGVRIISQDETGMVLDLRTSRFETREIEVDGTAYQRLTIPGYTHGLTERVGSPELPVKGYWVDLPGGMNIELEVEKVETETSSGYLVYPVPQKIALDDEVIEEFALDPQAYARDGFSPDERVRKGTIAYLRDQKKAQVLFSPLSFNPQTGTLRLHALIRVSITFIPDQESEMWAFGFRTAPFGLAAADPNWPPAGSEHYKITTTDEGIYRFSSGELESAGMELATIDPRNLHLYNRGTEVAMHVSGEGDGSLDQNDYLLFYAESIKAKYTRTNVYWLVAEDTPGLRMAEVNGNPGSAPVAEDFTSTVHHERDRFYWRQAPGEDSVDRWFFDYDLMVRAGTAVDFPIDLPGVSPNPSGDTATVTVALRGAAEDTFHQVNLSMNHTQIAQQSWQGQDEYRIETDIDHGLLVPGENIITIELLGSDDNLLLDWIGVVYRRTFEAIDNSLTFSSEAGLLFTIPGFTENTLSVFDITDPLQAGRILITPPVEGPPSTYTLSFQDERGGTEKRTYIALGASQMKTAQGITKVAPPDLMDTQNGADYVIITHPDIGWNVDGTPCDWLRDLSEYRGSQGLRVLAIDIDEIHDSFTYGISDPQAIKDFLGYAYANWQPPAPQYVLLVGDATFDPKGNFFAPQPGVPTYLGWAHYMGETAMDDWFVQIVGDDGIGDLYLGRLPAANMDEAQVMVDKIINYEEAPWDQPWQKRLLLVADNEEVIFKQTKESVSTLVPVEYSLIKGYLSDYTVPDLTNLIIDEINQGVLIANYAGHGFYTYWAHENIFEANRDIPMLSNDQTLPVMALMTCLNGYFLIPSTRSLPEQMLVADGAGAVAAFASTGMNLATPQKVLDEGFFEAIFGQGFTQLGQATNYAKGVLLANFPGEQDTADTYGLMGDPAMTLPVGSPPDPHTVSTPTTPSGPTTGEINTSYSYTTGGSTCSEGHAVEYRFDWGDGIQSGWSASTSASHTWSTAGSYSVRAEARCSVTTTIVSSPSPGLAVTISTPHTVSTPTTPSGPTTGEINTSYTYTTGGSTCSEGHAVEYRFDWGDGTYSSWSTSTSASHQWAADGTYTVRAEARCSINTSIVSDPSAGLTVSISTPHTVSAPTTPSGPTTGEPNTSYTYSTGGAACSHGHAVEYRFDWGDGTYSSWSTSTSASHQWAADGTYTVRAEARCSINNDITSDPSAGLTVSISTPHTVSAPTTPSGPTTGEPNTSCTYSTGGSACSHGHDVEHRFDWGDGMYSAWSTSTSASHQWAADGTYTVRAEARCSINGDPRAPTDMTWSTGLTGEMECIRPGPHQPAPRTSGQLMEPTPSGPRHGAP